jgi:capsular polysaccharide biosynthesis protein
VVSAPLRFGEGSATGCDRFDYAPGQPNLYLMMRFKQDLVAEHGLTAGAEIYRATLSKQTVSEIVERDLEGLYDYCRRFAVVFEEITPAGIPFRVEPPPVIGPGNHRPIEGETRAFYVAAVADGRARGRSSLIEAGGRILADVQGDELERIDDEVEFDSAVFHRQDRRVWSIRSDLRYPRAFKEAVSLLGCRTDFFGDWICETITKYVAASRTGLLPPAPILIDASMPASHRQALEMMLPQPVEIVEIPAFAIVEAERLWVIPSIAHTPFHQVLNARFKWDYATTAPAAFVPVRREMLRRADRALGPVILRRKLFLARHAFRHRKLVNKDEIEAIAAGHGFAIVYPEDLAFADQVRLFRDASHVVAPEGSAMYLYFFRSDFTRICVLNHPLTDGLVAYEDGDVDLTVISGPQVGPLKGRSQDMDYEIDPRVFDRFLAEWAS